ncbi:MAG: High-affnity carbon uptake protein Hat/HatR [uncultured Sulfurovum sp.]|uniref:High-affnity carbon uptake protein Hat/HatR n=1 Tax=uncultured Sulfurovum sp. TaxID=269237 RepID=A0A6S6TJV5_9BACT|nr:MAG: High-affnity carbon uptake protein Hat/HatR [uncultured Sulfurovum sp.]
MNTQRDNSTFLIKSSKNRSFGTGFCIYKDEEGSYLLTAAHVVESCGVENLLIESLPAKLFHISQENGSLDLALVYVEGLLNTAILKLCQEKAIVGERFDIVGYRPHKKDHAKEPLKGYIKKAYTLESEEKRDIYELRINEDDSIEQGYSGSAVVSTVTGLVIAIATDRKTNGQQAYATPTYYLKEIWKEMPKDFFESFSDTNPYKGLNSFEYEDRENYYGREEESQEIASRLKTTKLFTLLGASGSGKSSLIFAGVLPLIKSDEVEVLSFRPLDEPFKNLASVFIPILYTDKLEQLRKEKELAHDLFKNNITLTQLVEMLLEQKGVKHLYLIIDQFEELFTLTEESSSKNAFLDQLLLVINSDLGVTLLLSMRADFLSHISYYDSFNKAYNTHPSQMLSLLRREKLRRVIELPAKKMGVEFQEGLVERIIEEIEDEAGQLPLLEFALEQFWVNKKGRIISHVVLDEMQSISHSISHYADRVYERNPTYHASIKKVLIKLVNPGSGKEDTRRIASFDEFDKESRKTITLLANERLIVTEDGNIDIVHEALIREWQRLEKWINDYRDFLEWEKHLRDDRKFYVKNGSKKEDLLVESKLLRAKEFLESHEEYISPLDKGFVKKSIVKAKLKRKMRLIGLSLIFVSLLGVTGVIFSFWKSTENQKGKVQNILYNSTIKQGIIARDYFKESLKSKLIFANALSQSLDEYQFEKSKLLYRSSFKNNFQLKSIMEYNQSIDGAIFTKNENKILSWNNFGTMQLWDKSSLSLMKEYISKNTIEKVVFSKNEQKILSWGSRDTTVEKQTSSSEGIVQIWNRASPYPLYVFKHDSKVNGVKWTKDETKILVWTGDFLRTGTILLWSSDNNSSPIQTYTYTKPDGMFGKTHTGAIIGAMFNRDESEILSWSDSGILVLWDTESSVPIQVFELNQSVFKDAISSMGRINGAIFNQNESEILSWHGNGIVTLWSRNSKTPLKVFRHEDFVESATFNKNETEILSWSKDGTIKLWNKDNNTSVLYECKHQNLVNVYFSKNEKEIFSFSSDGVLKIWDRDGRTPVQVFRYDSDFKEYQQRMSDVKIKSFNNIGDMTFLNKIFKHNQNTSKVVLNSSGEEALSYSRDGTLKLWNYNQSVRKKTKIKTKNISVTPNNKLHLWGINNPIPLKIFEHKSDYNGLQNIQKDNQMISWTIKSNLMSDWRSGTIKLWDTNSTRPLQVYNSAIDGALFSKKDEIFLTWGGWNRINGRVYLWDYLNTTPIKGFLFGSDLKGATFNNDENKVIAWGGGDMFNISMGKIKLWDINSSIIKTYEQSQGVEGVVFSPNDKYFLSWGGSNILNLWNEKNRNPLKKFKHSSNVKGAFFTKDSTKILSWSADKTLKLWSIKQTTPIQIFKHHQSIKGAILSKTEQYILSWDSNTMKLWENNNSSAVKIFKSDIPISRVKLNKDETKILSWNSFSVTLWDINYSSPLNTFIHQSLEEASFIDDNNYIYSRGKNGIKLHTLTSKMSLDKKHYPLKTQVETGAYLTPSGEVKALTKKEWEAKKIKYEKILVETKD